MSKYTTEVRWIVEQAERDATGKYSVGKYTQASYEALGLAHYSIFDEDYRAYLNDKIINHFYFREIGFETRAHFAFQMARTLEEIMPYYNTLYEAIAEVGLKPFIEIDMKYDDSFGETKDTKKGYTDSHDIDAQRDHTRTDNLTKKRTDELQSKRTDNLHEVGNNESATTVNQQNIFQDTPMSMLPDSTVHDLKYATNVTYDDSDDSTHNEYSTDNTGTQTTDNTGTQTTSDTGTQKNVTKDVANNVDSGNSEENWKHGGGNERHEYGRRHTQAYLFKEFKDAMINIDMEVIGDLETLFMGVW